MKKIKYIFFNLFFLFLASSCQTPGYYIVDEPHQLADIRKTVNAVIGKTKFVSINGRELFSDFHDYKFEQLPDPLEINTDPFYRYQTKVTVLGARRPYEINVQVLAEQYENESKKFVLLGVEDDLSKQRAIALKKALHLSPGIKAGFDEEKPF